MLTFDLNAEIKRLRNEDAWQAGRNSKTLVKHAHFRMVPSVRKPEAPLHEHKAAGRISVQTVAGHCGAKSLTCLRNICRHLRVHFLTT